MTAIGQLVLMSALGQVRASALKKSAALSRRSTKHPSGWFGANSSAITIASCQPAFLSKLRHKDLELNSNAAVDRNYTH
jgi:hypothetical protein